MKWAVLVVRIFVGLGLTFSGASYFFMPPMDMPMPDVGKQIMLGFASSHWMDVVKVCELVGGLLLLSGRLTPLGVVVAMPVAVNIAAWDVLIMKQPGVGLVLIALLGVVMAGYWNYFSPFFRPTAKMV